MKFSPNYKFTPTTPGAQDVTVTIRRFTHGMRVRVRTELASILEKIRAKSDELTELTLNSGLLGAAISQPEADEVQELELDENQNPILPASSEAPEEGKRKAFTPAQIAAIDKANQINEDIQLITSKEVDVIYLQHGFVMIEGLDIDGIDKPYDWKKVQEYGPEALTDEIIREIKKQSSGLTDEAKENLG